MPHRKKPFSSKQKKEQLKSKREKKRNQDTDEFGRASRKRNQPLVFNVDQSSSDDDGDQKDADVEKLNQQPLTSSKTDQKYDPNRYRLHFAKESQKQINRRKDEARWPYRTLPEASLEVDLDEVYQPGSALDMPKRPAWDYSLSKAALEAREEAYFKRYLDTILSQHDVAELSYFELNLETWRQLWRVLEMADVVLLITDIRHPALHFSPALYKFVTHDLSKPMILVLNKCDLAPPSLVTAWTHYFRERFPDVRVVRFTSYPRQQDEETSGDPSKVLHKRRRRRMFSAVGQKQLLEACEEIVQGKVDLSSWRDKIDGELAGKETDHQVELRLEEAGDYHSNTTRYKDGMLTIGCCGYPNVGKSSVMNGLMGKKVVSVSKTPGHTKHFQTIYLTPTVKLCDSPGLVFPSLVHKPMQILAGIYPIAQVREPYSAVQYLAERLPLVSLLKIRHPEDDGKSDHVEMLEWSAFDICDAWAEKRGFLTAKAARHDVYRAANHLLRLAVDGRLCLCTWPPGYTKQKDHWETHPDTIEFTSFQASQHAEGGDGNSQEDDSEEEEEEDGEEEEDRDEVVKESSSGGRSVGVTNPFLLLADD